MFDGGILGNRRPPRTGANRYIPISFLVLHLHRHRVTLDSVCVCVCVYTRTHLQHRSPREPDLDSTFQERAFSRHDSDSSRPLRSSLFHDDDFTDGEAPPIKNTNSNRDRFLYESRIATVLVVSRTGVAVEFFGAFMRNSTLLQRTFINIYSPWNESEDILYTEWAKSFFPPIFLFFFFKWNIKT